MRKSFWEINSIGKNSVQGNERNSLTTIELNINSFSKKELRERNSKKQWHELKKIEILQLKKQNKEQNSNIGNTYIRHYNKRNARSEI